MDVIKTAQARFRVEVLSVGVQVADPLGPHYRCVVRVPWLADWAKDRGRVVTATEPRTMEAHWDLPSWLVHHLSLDVGDRLSVVMTAAGEG